MRVKGQFVLVPVSRTAMGEQYALDLNNITRRSTFDMRILQMHGECARNTSLVQLVRSLLNLELLHRTELRVSSQESKLATHFVFHTLLRDTTVQRSVARVKDL